MTSQSELGRLSAAPPGMSPERLEVLRYAYARALNDPELVARAKRLGLPLKPLSGEEVEQRVQEALRQSPEILALIREFAVQENPAR